MGLLEWCGMFILTFLVGGICLEGCKRLSCKETHIHYHFHGIPPPEEETTLDTSTDIWDRMPA